MNLKRKLSTILAVGIILVLLIGGTFAWINFSQSKVNEWSETAKPDNTLHDHFCKPRKEVFIENWGKVTTYVRIRLDEYMEIGEGAGEKGTLSGTTWTPNPENKSKSVIVGANINNKKTWKPHVPIANDPTTCSPTPIATGLNGFHYYWKWSMGGQTYYLPVNPLYAKEPGFVAQDTAEYTATTPNVKQTLPATVLTMAQWIAGGQKIGNYWVIDSDGWCYWAAPLNPGTATGLLLSKVDLIRDPDDSYYYAINVIAQMATKNGEQNYKDFYRDPNDPEYNATPEGKELLEIITGNKDPNRVAATSVSINGDRVINLKVGQSVSITATKQPSNSTDPILWSSQYPTTASITSAGVITANAVGTTKITATAGDKTDEISVVVTAADIPATSISISGPTTMKVGDTAKLTYSLTPTNSTDKPTWQSSNTAVATIDNEGNILAKGEGTTVITATARTGVYTTINIKVEKADVPAYGIQITGANPRIMTVNTSVKLGYTLNPANSTDIPTWESSNTNVATVDNQGNVTAKNIAGETVITATARPGVISSITVKVETGVLPHLGLKGDGNYDTKHDDRQGENYQKLNYALRCKFINGQRQPDEMDQNGSIKLEDILSSSDFAGISVKAANSSMSQYFTIGTDKDGDAALIYTYIPSSAEWTNAKPDLPVIEVNLILSKTGFSDTPIKIKMRYDGSFYR